MKKENKSKWSFNWEFIVSVVLFSLLYKFIPKILGFISVILLNNIDAVSDEVVRNISAATTVISFISSLVLAIIVYRKLRAKRNVIK